MPPKKAVIKRASKDKAPEKKQVSVTEGEENKVKKKLVKKKAPPADAEKKEAKGSDGEDKKKKKIIKKTTKEEQEALAKKELEKKEKEEFEIKEKLELEKKEQEEQEERERLEEIERNRIPFWKLKIVDTIEEGVREETVKNGRIMAASTFKVTELQDKVFVTPPHLGPVLWRPKHDHVVKDKVINHKHHKYDHHCHIPHWFIH